MPDHVTANVSCQGNDLSVFWEESAGADLYTAVLEDSNGQFTSCQSMNHTTCTVNRLSCGQSYRVSVIASDGYCDSLPSAVTDVHSGKNQCEHIHTRAPAPAHALQIELKVSVLNVLMQNSHSYWVTSHSMLNWILNWNKNTINN